MNIMRGLLACSFTAASLVSYCQSPGLEWVSSFGGGDPKAIRKMTTDNSGNIYTVGSFNDLLDADPSSGEHLLFSDEEDAFIIKQKPNGALDWVIQLTGEDSQVATTVNVGTDGNIVVAGYFQETVAFDGGVDDSNEYTSPNKSAFIMKVDPDGDFIWVRAFTDFGATSVINAVAIDASNNILIGGQMTGPIDADPSGGNTFPLEYGGGNDLWFAKFNAAGNFISAVSLGDAGDELLTRMTIDHNNELIAAGSFAGAVDFNPGAGITTLTSNGADDIFILKLSNTLGYVWSDQIEANQLYIGGMDIDASNNVILNGTFDSGADFDPGAGVVSLSGVNGDFFIASYNSSGNINWAERAGSLDFETGQALAVDASGNIYVAGTYDGQFDIDPALPFGNEVIQFEGPGIDMYVAKFNSAGALLWYHPIPSTNNISIADMHVGSNNDIYLAGDWNGIANFSFNTCVDAQLNSDDEPRLYVLKVTPASNISCFGFLEQPVASQVGCEMQEIIVAAPAGGTTHIRYQWQIFRSGAWHDITDQEFNEDTGANGYEGSNTAYLKIMAVAAGESGDLRVMVNGDGVATIYSNTSNFTIKSTPPLPALTATSGCGPGYYALSAAGTTYGKYQWYIDDVLQESDTTENVSYFFNSNARVGVAIRESGCSGDKALVSINTDACSQPPGLEWVQQFSPGSIEPVALAVDNNDDVYIAGRFSNTVDFNLGVGVFEMTPTGGQDYFVAKYKGDGTFFWAKQTDMTILDMSTGGGDDVYYVGYFRGTLDFDPGPGIFDMTVVGGGTDMAIVELASDGVFEWAKQLAGTSGDASNAIRAVSDGPSGEIVITGNFTKTIDFDPGAGVTNLTSASSAGPDIFVAKYDDNGDLLWARRMGGTAFVERGQDIEVDSDGNIYTVGLFQTSVDFDPTGSTFTLTSAGATDAFIQCLYPDGTFRWAKRLGSTGTDEALGIDLDSNDHPVVIGNFNGTVDFDPDVPVVNMTSGSQPSYILKLTDLGAFEWVKQTGGVLEKIFVDPTNRITVTGEYTGNVDVDPGPDEYRLETAISLDLYVMQFSDVGDLQWAYNTNASGLEYFTTMAAGVAMDTEGNLYVLAWFSGTTDVDPTNCVYPLTSSNGTRELFIQKIKPNLATICFSLQPVDTKGCDGLQVMLSAEAVGTTNIGYQWQVYNTTFGYFENIAAAPGYSGITAKELVIDATTTFGSGLYRVIVTGDNASSTTSNVADVHIDAIPGAPTFTPVSYCSPGQKTMSVSGGVDGSYIWYDDSFTPIAGAVNHEYLTPFLTGTTTYYVSVLNGVCESAPAQADVIINISIDEPLGTGASSCSSPAILVLKAEGEVGGEFRWYENAEDSVALLSTFSDSFTTPALTQTHLYYVSLSDGTCESLRTEVEAHVGALSAPTAPDVARCGPGVVLLVASGGVDGEYRWYTQGSGGTAIAGQVDDTFDTPPISVSTDYFVSIDDGSCESSRTKTTALIGSPPAAPSVNAVTICTNNSANITATAGATGEVRWYETAIEPVPLHTGTTFSTPALSVTTIYHVAYYETGCESTRTPVTVTVTNCANNQPPVIAAVSPSTTVGEVLTVDLGPLLSDPDDNLDLTTLKIKVQPTSGAVATIDQNGHLSIDYTGVSFTGDDNLTIEVCDIAGACVQRVIVVRVDGDVVIYNAISPNNDGKNDVFYLAHIGTLESTKNNRVWIYNRWGEVVFDIENYDNLNNVFVGRSNNGKDLPSGTYFYKIEYRDRKTETGYLSLKR